MTDTSLDQAVIQTMNELMRASSDCAEYDPGMSAKFATAAKDLGRDLGITSVESENVEDADLDDEESEEEDEFRDLLHLLDLQKKAVAAAEVEMQPKSRFGWLGLDSWSRW
ncbi:MAG: hypothetical protein ACR2RF_19025 [Geminicoccaceae bacterium]